MKVTGEHQFRIARDQVWAGLQDPADPGRVGAGRPSPGADRNGRVRDHRRRRRRIGKGTYEGTFALTDKQECEACTVRARASGRPGSVDAVAQMRLADRDAAACC